MVELDSKLLRFGISGRGKWRWKVHIAHRPVSETFKRDIVKFKDKAGQNNRLGDAIRINDTSEKKKKKKP